ncbi:unnamed protein product [Penicillium salamii]|nr:unnamed protein product [Penicillium salamii]CAG8254213.1 unnamed protein product [Penicillium salamii]CAG8271095.1 unnamed protein product [Penicillium salamii]
MSICKPYDDVAWAISTQLWEDWPELLRTDGDICNEIGVFLSEEFSDLKWASFGFLSTGEIRNEVSIMQFLLEKSPIPVPSIFRWGETKESPSDLGPFIIMNYIHHKRSMGDLLEMPGRQGGQPPVLNPDLKLARLEALYGKLANIVLSLSTLSFNRIGSLGKNDHSTREVLHRPLSYSMNEIVQLGTLPRSELPINTYDNASSYFEALADLHISHLRSQRNEADVEANVLADHIRRKFVARFLFRKLVRDKDQRKE